MRRWTVSLLAFLLAATMAAAQPAPVAPPPFLVIDQDRLLSESRMGQAVLAEEEADRNRLQEEGQALDRAFEAEELELTERRSEMAPEEFRTLADAFDQKVVATRREQEQKARDLTRAAEERRRAFFRKVTPILLEILRETGAAAVVDQRSLLISKQDLNITDEVIRRLDASIDGSSGTSQE